jgi:hypothetical protein
METEDSLPWKQTSGTGLSILGEMNPVLQNSYILLSFSSGFFTFPDKNVIVPFSYVYYIPTN